MAQVNWHNWQTDTQLNLFYGMHLYEHGKKIWYQRKPEAAYKMMLQAKVCLESYRNVMKGQVGKPWQDQMEKILEVIRFLKVAGVKGE
jgi:hypothetical protein